jgi:hypothetical protein
MSKLKEVKDQIDTIKRTAESLFITCASYEPRTSAVALRLSGDYRVKNAVVCRAVEYLDQGRSQELFDEVFSSLGKRALNPIYELRFPLSQPVDFIRKLGQHLRRIDIDDGGITVDISTFPRRELLILLHLLQSRYPDVGLRLLYSEPSQYATENSDTNKRWLTQGVRAVEPIPGFCGIQYPRRGSLLVMILGHEGERTHITLRRHQPDKVIFLGQGAEQFHQGLREIAEDQNRQMIEQYGESCFWSTRLSAHGVQQTAIELNRIFQQHRYSYNMFVAPNGTKLQALGAYLAAKQNPEIQITYAEPVLYNWEVFSEGSGKIWDIALNDLSLDPEAQPEMIAANR